MRRCTVPCQMRQTGSVKPRTPARPPGPASPDAPCRSTHEYELASIPMRHGAQKHKSNAPPDCAAHSVVYYSIVFRQSIQLFFMFFVELANCGCFSRPPPRRGSSKKADIVLVFRRVLCYNIKSFWVILPTRGGAVPEPPYFKASAAGRDLVLRDHAAVLGGDRRGWLSLSAKG